MRDAALRAPARPASAAMIAVAGLVALAVAMGIGRFAFTPILPMMQADAGLSLRGGGWLAAANYLGYLLGALGAARLSPSVAMRGGLLAIAAVTFAMGLAVPFGAWLVLRLVAGVASAWVLVHVSAWALEHLVALARPALAGVVFAGVGAGIAGAGLVCLALMAGGVGSARTWELLGLVSLLLTVALWRSLGRRPGAAAMDVVAAAPTALRWDADKLRLALCYAAFGFGYIIPATFLPAMARGLIADPAVFGWAWPVFGLAAAGSTFAVAYWLRGINDRRLWAIAHALMALGVVLPALSPSLPAILLAALLVGGTFMVVTMTGLREARRVAAQSATAFIGILTAAFALGQMLGPLVVSALAGWRYGVDAALLAAACILLATAAWLRRPPAPALNRG